MCICCSLRLTGPGRRPASAARPATRTSFRTGMRSLTVSGELAHVDRTTGTSAGQQPVAGLDGRGIAGRQNQMMAGELDGVVGQQQQHRHCVFVFVFDVQSDVSTAAPAAAAATDGPAARPRASAASSPSQVFDGGAGGQVPSQLDACLVRQPGFAQPHSVSSTAPPLPASACWNSSTGSGDGGALIEAFDVGEEVGLCGAPWLMDSRTR